MDMQKINAMREGGKILGTLLAELKDYVDVGMTKRQLDAWVRQKSPTLAPTSLMMICQKNFLALLCISVNVRVSSRGSKIRITPSKMATRFPSTSLLDTKVITPMPPSLPLWEKPIQLSSK